MEKQPIVWAGIAVLAIIVTLHAQTAISVRPVFIRAPVSSAEDDLKTMIQAVELTKPEAADSRPMIGTFWSAQNPTWPPLPGNTIGVPVWPLDAETFILADENFDYAALEARPLRGGMLMMAMDGPPGLDDGGDGTNSEGGGFAPAYSFPMNGLWLEITNVEQASQTADLILHNTSDTHTYQLLSRTNLLQPDWILGNIQYGDPGTNQTLFSSVNLANPAMFFNAHQSDVILYLEPGQDAVEPRGTDPGQVGTFYLATTDVTNDLTVYYRMSGTASNGVDYTNLSGVVTVPAALDYAYIDVEPIADSLPEGVETVTLTLIQTNTYLIGLPSATIRIFDSSTTVSMGTITSEAIESNGPPRAAAQAGSFSFERFDFRGRDTNALDVYYQVTGTASNGVDYAFLNGVMHFAPGLDFTNLDVNPLLQKVIANLQTVTATLLPTNSYLIYTNNQSGTVTIVDSSTTVGIVAVQNAIKPGQTTNFPGQSGYFTVSRTDTRNIYTNLTVNYLISGTASNGVDYATLSNSVTFAPDDMTTNIYVQPLTDGLIKCDETVILTLLQTNGSTFYGYDLDANNASATVIIKDDGDFVPVVTTLTAPIGIDYQAPSNSLIVSYNYYYGAPKNFAQIYTNLIVSNSILVTNVVITNWSGIGGLQDEIKLATVKTNTGGFTNGDMYFSSGTGIGRVSANGSVSNLNWGTLTNNTLGLRGGICVDQTGMFSNDVIAVTSNGNQDSALKGVWRIDSQAHPTLLANINTLHLEGVTTVPNDTNKFGPWAGKIITGDEDKSPPLIYTINTNGTVATYDTTALTPDGIHPEDFDIIPPNQNLYGCDPDAGVNTIVKLSANYLTNYVGDLMITDGGEVHPPAKLFIVHWDASITNFVTVYLSYVRHNGSNGHFEHVTFAPIDLPAQ